MGNYWPAKSQRESPEKAAAQAYATSSPLFLATTYTFPRARTYVYPDSLIGTHTFPPSLPPTSRHPNHRNLLLSTTARNKTHSVIVRAAPGDDRGGKLASKSTAREVPKGRRAGLRYCVFPSSSYHLYISMQPYLCVARYTHRYTYIFPLPPPHF